MGHVKAGHTQNKGICFQGILRKEAKKNGKESALTILLLKQLGHLHVLNGNDWSLTTGCGEVYVLGMIERQNDVERVPYRW